MTGLEKILERRNERRVPCRFTLSVMRASGERALANAVDLSPAGMRFQTVGRTIGASDSLLVQFTVNAKTYSFCGHPLRITEPAPFAQEVAVRFRAVDGRTRAFLADSIRRGIEPPLHAGPLSGE